MPYTRGMKADHNKGPCFFQIIVDEAHLEYLKIPPKFVRKFMSNCLSDEEVTLRGPSNVNMIVKLSKHENGIYLKNGWATFCRNHSIGNKDFLLFRYDGNGCFRVQIFKVDGCERLGDCIAGLDQYAASSSSGKRTKK